MTDAHLMLTIDHFIASASSIAALATALATFLTVREIARQRKAAVRPDLISERQYAYVYSEQPVSCLRHIWSRERLEGSEVSQQSSYRLALFNVGTGSAKQVRAKWTIDVSPMIANVNILAREASVSVSAELIPEDSDIRVLWPDKAISNFLVTNQLEEDLGHLLPASLSEGLQISVPSVYLSLVSLQIALGLTGKKTVASAKEWLRIPPAYLTLRYTDLHGEDHVKKLQFVLVLLGAGHQGVAHTAGQLPTFMQFMANLNET